MNRAGPLDGWYPHAPPRVAHDISAPGKHLSMQLGLGMALGAYYSSPRPWGGAFWLVTRSMDGVSTCHHSTAPVETTGGAAFNTASMFGDLTHPNLAGHGSLALGGCARMPGRARGPLYGPTALPRHPAALGRRRHPLPRRRGEIHQVSLGPEMAKSASHRCHLRAPLRLRAWP